MIRSFNAGQAAPGSDDCIGAIGGVDVPADLAAQLGDNIWILGDTLVHTSISKARVQVLTSLQLHEECLHRVLRFAECRRLCDAQVRLGPGTRLITLEAFFAQSHMPSCTVVFF